MPKRGDVLSFTEMCSIEGKMLQPGMHFRKGKNHSVILMSQRKNAPYPDRISEDGRKLLYVGHDAYGVADKKAIDQPLITPAGQLTENGKFFKAVQDVKQLGRTELVRVYEKVFEGVWVFNGLFRLIDARMEATGPRKVCIFELELIQEDISEGEFAEEKGDVSPGRLIPTLIKQQVWKRDRGKCVLCGATTGLHFDHIIPHSRGGSSVKLENVQLLCQRHNLEKSARIE